MACFRLATATRVAQLVSVFNRLTFTTCIHCRGFEALLKTLVSQCFQRTDAVLLWNDDRIVGWRSKQGFQRMNLKQQRCDRVTYLVIAMQSRSRAPHEGLP